jgi:hypothetical protein
VKIAFVAGFFDPVKKALEEEPYSGHQSNGSLIWIRQKAMNREVNLHEFSSRFFDRVKQADSVLTLLAILRGREWAEASVQAIITRAKEGMPDLSCEMLTFRNAGDRSGVLKAIDAFGLASPSSIGRDKVRAKVSEEKVLCVSLEGKTSILDALRRAGFEAETVQAHFYEERIDGARNSGLMEHLALRAGQYRHLLYAWDGLRTLKPEVGRKFTTCCEAPNAAKVVQLFKKWIEQPEPQVPERF